MSATTEPMDSPGAAPAQADALAVDGLDITYRVRGRPLTVVRDVSFRIARGESYGLVGESGCGKSTIALAVVRYLARNGSVSGGSISIDGRDVLTMRGGELRKLRANTVSMVYQEPGKALNPTIRVGPQVAEVFEIAGVDSAQARDRAREMLEKVRISDPALVMNRFPHQLSGGMLQRVVIAMALAAEPSLLILDEPTQGVDVGAKAEIHRTMAALAASGMAILMISSELPEVLGMSDRIAVMRQGTIAGVLDRGDATQDRVLALALGHGGEAPR